MAANAVRAFDLNSAPHCPGIPAGVDAYSLNFVVAETAGPSGDIRTWPTGNPPLNVSTLVWTQTNDVVANAAIVGAGTNGSIDVQVAGNNTHLIIDINGYFTDSYNTGVQFVAISSMGGQGAISGTNTSSTNNSAGVNGLATATSGRTFGVFGKTSSTPVTANASAGVKGVDSGGELSTLVIPSSSGVRGDSVTGIGVAGFSRGTAVSGSLLDVPGGVSAAGYLGYSVGPYGVYAVGDIGATGMKFFVEPHPTDASKVIRFVALEGPEAGTYFRGSSRTVGGWATIEVPESFRIVTDGEGLTVQLTPVGDLVQLAVIQKGLSQITVRSSRDVLFDYEVKGIRRSFRHHEAIADGSEFAPTSPYARLPGYLTEEARRRLITNGTYREDGSVNLTTADRLGWPAIWERPTLRIPAEIP
jgi:hypothetical protein